MSSTPNTRAAARLRLSEVSADIENLEIALASLRAEQKVIQEHLNAYTYPIFTLPNEIVSEIFLHYIPVYPARPPLYGDCSPEKLAQICRRWREIAHSTPSLWRAMCMVDPCAEELSLARRWAERSRTLPLSIRLRCNQHGDRAALAFETLLPHRMRWQYIALHLPNDEIATKIEGEFPTLLEIDSCFSDDTWLGTVTGENLSIVYLRQHHYAEFPDHRLLRIPWNQLTTLYLESLYHDVAASVLRETKALMRCRLAMVAFDDEPRTSTPMRLDAMQTLIVEFRGNRVIPNDAVDFFQPLQMPNLKHLFIQDNIGGVERPLPPLLSIIEGLRCTLDRLCVAGAALSNEQCRAAFPGIAHVEVVGYAYKIDANREIWGYWNKDDSAHDN